MAENTAGELLPCPFCGGIQWNAINSGTTILLNHLQRDKAIRYQVLCQNKKCDVKPKTSIWITREDAVKAWNKRAPAAPSQDDKAVERG